MKQHIATGIVASLLLIAAVPNTYGQQPTENMQHVQKVEKIDINSATVEQLTTLKGIGQSKARAIVEYRSKIGGFTHLDDLKEVRGIGNKLLEKLESQIQVLNTASVEVE